MNRIKTNDRNRLGQVLVHCMLISMYAKDFDWDWEAMGKYVATKLWDRKTSQNCLMIQGFLNMH